MFLFVYLTYIDESGKPERTDSENEFVLAALSINESEWKRIGKKMTDLKLKYFPNADPGSIEFHTTDIISHKGAFKGMNVVTRLEIIEDLVRLVSETNCHISAVVIRKDELTNPELDVGLFAMKLLFDRLCSFHDHMNSARTEDEEEYGILMIDSVDSKYDNRLRIKIRELCKSETRRIKNRYLIEDPIFVDSKYRHLSQLVDCVAYCIRRKHRSRHGNPKDAETFERFYLLMEKKVCNCKRCGIKIFPEKA